MTQADLERIVLLRCDPAAPGCAVSVAPASAERTLVFLHGEAVALADRPETVPAGTVCGVCSTSWRRRFCDRRPPAPFETSTLAVLLARLAAAPVRVDSHGLGGACCSPPGGPGGFLLEIAFAPRSPREAEETIEWLLAAAAVELDARVVFSGAGRSHLEGERGRAWRQFTEFGLFELFAVGAPDPAAGAASLSAAEAAILRGDCGRVIVL